MTTRCSRSSSAKPTRPTSPLPRHGLINLTFGNASAIDRAQGVFAIKPSGVDYATLTPDDMVLVDLEGERSRAAQPLVRHADPPPALPRLSGRSAASSTPIRRTRPPSPRRAAPIPFFGTTHADYFYGEVPVTRKMTASEIASAYEWETGKVIVERCRTLDPAEFPGVLVNRHAPFAWGATAAKAVETAVAVECIAQMALMSLQLAPELEPIEPELARQALQAQARAGRLLRAALRAIARGLAPSDHPCSEITMPLRSSENMKPTCRPWRRSTTPFAFES